METKESGDSKTSVYEYDAVFNRIHEVETETIGGVDTPVKNRTLEYDETNWLTQITEDGSGQTIAYLYDANGNTLRKVDNKLATLEETGLVYNSRDQLVETARGPPGSPTTLGQYDYNYAGLRIRHAESDRGDVEYIYDDQAVLEERSLTAEPTAQNTGDLIAHYQYGDRLISLSSETDQQFYHYQSLKTTSNLRDQNGGTKVSYRTDVWGEITEQEGESENRQIYTGQEHDERTGLIYFGARFYDPDTARFLNQDTYLGEQGVAPSLHRYLYAYANPTVFIDPNGRIGIFFDGTDNNQNRSGESLTNVAKLYNAYGGEGDYYPGVGSSKLTKILGGVAGAGGKRRIKKAYNSGELSDSDKPIDIFGFSRGSAQARDLANMINEKGIPKQVGSVLVEGGVSGRGNETFFIEKPIYDGFHEDAEIRFLGLYDTVSSTGIPGNNIDLSLNLNVNSDSAKKIVHFVAQNEYRSAFDSQSIKRAPNIPLPSNMEEIACVGAHSDCGGGYPSNADQKSNELSRIPLHQMHQKAVSVGVPLKSLKPEDDISAELEHLYNNRSYPEVFKKLQEKYIHDSRYFYERHRKKRTIYYSTYGDQRSAIS